MAQTDLSKIRNRVSYGEFKELHDMLNKPSVDIKDILFKVHRMIDRRSGFGSATNSNAAFESIEQLLKDEKIKKP
jgi:hypothetical protein